MKRSSVVWVGVVAMALMMAAATPTWAATGIKIGSSGKTLASTPPECAKNAATGQLAPVVTAGLFNAKGNTTAVVALNSVPVATVTTAAPTVQVWLADGNNTITVTLSKKVGDTYQFVVPAGMCALPDTSGNTFSPDGTLEYAASMKSYATVTPGCALNGATGLAQPYVTLFDNGAYLLNVSVNGVPLTQLSTTRPHTPVFLRPGLNVISAANGSLTVDYYVRDGASGTCTLP